MRQTANASAYRRPAALALRQLLKHRFRRSQAMAPAKPGEKALEGPQQPTLVIQKFAPGEIQVGKPAKFVLQVRNSGAQAADNVTIHDEIRRERNL